MRKYRKLIKEAIETIYPGLDIQLSTPPDPRLGDIALPCFPFAKAMRKSPAAIADELKQKLSTLDFTEKVESAGGYLNFFIKRHILYKDVLTEIASKKNLYGSSMSGSGMSALIEHTSINPNASPHVGRARNALIGDSIVRMLRFEGYDVDVHYFVNDVGKQIAMLLLGAAGKVNITFSDLLGIYVDINNRLEKEPELENEVFDLLYRMENGDSETKESFRKLVDTCIKGQAAIFGELGITYDSYDYESDFIYDKTTDSILAKLKSTGKLEEDEEGRIVLNQSEYALPLKAPYLVLTRKDKTSLYPLRDIAYSLDKMKQNPAKNILVLGEDQKLYFQQIKAALHLLGSGAPDIVHYSFVLLTEGKMSTRKGNMVLLEDFMREAVEKASDEMEKRHGKTDIATAKAIAYGSVKYAILRVSNEKNVTFDWETALSFEGDSGPYLQYSLARINSIFRKHGRELPSGITGIDCSVLSCDVEYELAKELALFPDIVQKAVGEFSPHIVANYVYGVTKLFSSFYSECPVLNCGDEKVREARLALIDAVRHVVQNGIALLGMEPVEMM